MAEPILRKEQLESLSVSDLGDSGALASKNTVSTSDIDNASITNDKIANGVDSSKIADGSISNEEFQRLEGVNSDIQGQIDNKEDSLGNPSSNGQVLSSQTDGSRSWVDVSTAPTYNPNNYTETSSSVDGHLEGLDTALGNLLSNAQTKKDINGNYTLIASDFIDNVFLQYDGTTDITVTIPPNSSVPLSSDYSVLIQAVNTGKITLQGGSGVTFTSIESQGQYSVIGATRDGVDNFYPLGDWKSNASDPTYSPSNYTETSSTIDGHLEGLDNKILDISEGQNHKLIDIGDWNMDSTSQVSIPHGLNANEWKTISEINVMIRDDDDSLYKPFRDGVQGITVVANFIFDHGIDINNTNIILDRQTGGKFTGVDYDGTGFNRGVISIYYTPNSSSTPSGTELYTENSAIVLPTAGTEDATTGSWIASSGTIDINTSDFDTGSRSFERSPSFAGNNGYFYLRMPDATNGETYTVSFRYKLTTVSATGVNVFIEGFDSSQPTTQITDTSGQWQTFTNTGTGTSSQFADIEFTFTGTTVEADTLLIDSFSVIQHD